MRQRHECPKDPDAFFAQLLAVMVYRSEPPDGFKECRICGGLIDVRPEPPAPRDQERP